MDNTDLIQIEEWRDIPIDSKFHYQASNLGRICHLYPDGNRKILKECYVKTLGGWVTGIVMADGTYRKFQTVTLVARSFLGNKDKSYQAIHINGIKSDHRISNIAYVRRSKIGSICNQRKRKPVCKINSDGEIVEVYKSARDCAEKNFFSYSTIKRRCCGDFNSVFAIDGYAYCYEDDDKQMAKLIREIELLNGKNLPENKNKYEFDF